MYYIYIYICNELHIYTTNNTIYIKGSGEHGRKFIEDWSDDAVRTE
jgi:hypothetical protein